MEGYEETDKQQPVSAEVPEASPETTTMTESAADESDFQDERAGKTGSVRTAEGNIISGTGVKVEEEIIAEGKKTLCVLNVGLQPNWFTVTASLGSVIARWGERQ